CGRPPASTVVLRKLARRAVEHPRAGELRLRLGGGHADPEQEQGHHANRALQASHSSSLQELSGLTTAGRPTLFTVDQPVSCGGPRRRDELIRGAGDRTGRHEIMDDWTGGRAVVELLKAEGVRQIFGIVGATFLDVLDTLYHDSSVEYINVRHEQAAAFMADGLARVTDRPGVCLVTSGPGATNLLTGVAAAYVAHSPVVVLVGGIALDHYQKDAFQEFDLVGMFRPVTKQALQITKADRIPELLRGALRTAMSGRQGPVFVEIPRDVLNGTLPPTAALAPGRYRVTHAQPPHADVIREAVQRLRQAERPLLLVGGGTSRAGANELVVQLSDRYGIPMITAYGRNDAVPNALPLYLGPLGRAGAPEAAAACRRADLILAVGSRLAQFPTQLDDRYLRSGTASVQTHLEAGAAPAYGYDRLRFARPRTFLTPLDLGGLGFAFPAALGAKLGRPEAPVVAIHGDGGYLMNAQELETAVRHGIGVVTIVMNNNCWGSEKAYQKHFYGGRYIGCDIGNPRYDQFARLFGAAGYYVERPDQVGDAVKKALSENSPAVIEIPIDPDEFPTPVAAVRRPD